MVLEIRYLKLVAAVVACGTLTGAAQRLNLTSSALSHQLKDLESRLRIKMFHRVGRRLALTEAGRRVHAVADEVLERLEAAERDLSNLAAGDGATLRVMGACFTSYHWLPRVARVGGFQIEIVPEATCRPLEALLSGEVDVVLDIWMPADPRLRSLPLFDDEKVALVAADHRLAGRDYLEPADLAEEHLLLYTPRDSILGDFLEPAGVRPRRTSCVALTEGLRELAAAGTGVAIGYRWALGVESDDGVSCALSLGPNGFWKSWRAVCLAGREREASIQAFVGGLCATGPAESNEAASVERPKTRLRVA